MLVKTILAAILLICAALPGASAKTKKKPGRSGYRWNKHLDLWNLGKVPPVATNPGNAIFELPGGCKQVKEGDYGCGAFGDGGLDKNVAHRAIYRCEKGRLIRKELCLDKYKYNRCVRNGRIGRGGKKFFPFVSSQKVVCYMKNEVYNW